jgi:hypothetical protein
MAFKDDNLDNANGNRKGGKNNDLKNKNNQPNDSKNNT